MNRSLLLGTLFLLVACGTSPEPSYFFLAPQDGAPMSDIKIAFKVQRPLMPDYLDRPDFVVQESDYHLSIDERSNWAEPLDKMFARILAADLQQRLPQSAVWAGNDDIAAPRFIVALTIQAFNPVARGDVSLRGNVLITDRKTGQPLLSKPFDLTAPASSSSRSIAAALSHLISLEANVIAQDLVTLTQSDQTTAN